MSREQQIHEVRERFAQLERTLNERERRLWAAAEVIRLGRGGISAVSTALRMSPNTIKKGLQEITAGPTISEANLNGRIRRPGGGRKPRLQASGIDPSSQPESAECTADDGESRLESSG